jgi:predicted nucleotidyltransferase
MKPLDFLDEIKTRLVKTYDPVEIYLFGSHAWGTPNDESDIDLLVVVEKSDEPKRFKRSLIGYDALLDLRVANDVVIYTEAEFEDISKDLTSLACKVKRFGKRIYARS